MTATSAGCVPGPIALTADSVAVLRPLAGGPYRIEAGFWRKRQDLNSTRSIPHGWQQLHENGQWDNLLRAAGRAPGQHTGRPYTDSDVYKMAEAQAWDSQHSSPVEEAQRRIRQVADLVAAAQEKSGYINSWFQCTGTEHFSNLQMGHEMYCAGHLIQAAVAAARTLVDSTDLLDSATAFADHLVETFADRPGVCGHPQIEMALVELYRQTGQDRYLRFAGELVARRGHGVLGPGWYGPDYYQDHRPVEESRELEGHCVRAMYLAAGATDIYLETGDEELLHPLIRQWEHTVATKTYLTGGVGCRRKTEAFGAPYELPPDQAFNETCAAVGNIMWSWRLLLATGESRFADHIERILYNVLAAAVSLDGTHFSYVNTLHRRGAAMEQGDKAPFRKSWFDCACCPPNLMRTISSLGHLIATTDADGIQMHQYASGSVTVGLGSGEPLALRVRTDYPWQGSVNVQIEAAPDRDCAIGLRIPGWCEGAVLKVNGEPVDFFVKRGYATVSRRWRPSDRITLDLNIQPRWTLPDRRVDAVRGCAAIEVGPLVYCFEDADSPPQVDFDDCTVDISQPMRIVSRPGLLGGTMVVECAGWAFPAGATPDWPYQTARRSDGAHGDPGDAPGGIRPITLTAIPYHLWDHRGRGRMRVWIPRS